MEEQQKTNGSDMEENSNDSQSTENDGIALDNNVNEDKSDPKKDDEQKKEVGKEVEEDRFMAALSYLGILVLIPLLIKKDDEFVQFHAKQGVVLLVIWFVGMILFMIPIMGQLLALAILVLNVIALIQALNGKRWEIPIIGEYAKKIKL